ncbi:hypothetical protein M0R04_16605, partial [Candidatus Dojkabacteria bacterium]|nr:hypothetical protein [Candidatus Dojkabacteria bacterium]
CVFLSKFGNTFDTIAKLYDDNPKVMSISQLHGYSSDEIFASNKVGMKNIPAETGGAGGPSPMCSTFRMAAWTEHELAPLCSRPGTRAGNGFIDFFLSTIGNGFEVMNFPFYSSDYVYHIGGGTARRNLGNLAREIKVAYGSAMDISRYGSRCTLKETYDYYCGAHYIDMTSPEFKAHLEKAYSIPFDQLVKFDETILKKLQLEPKREIGFRPSPFAVTDRLEYLRGPRNERNKSDYDVYDTYQYGVK